MTAALLSAGIVNPANNAAVIDRRYKSNFRLTSRFEHEWRPQRLLHPRRQRRVQEPQKWIDPRGPGAFAVTGSLDFVILQVIIGAPAFLDEQIAQLTRPFPTGLLCAGIEPDFERQFVLQ